MGLDTYFYRVNREAYNVVNELNIPHIHYDREDVGYFRKFWGLMRKIQYTNEDYGNFKEVPKELLVKLHNEAKRTLEIIENHLIDHRGLTIKKSFFDCIESEDDNQSSLLNEDFYLVEISKNDDIISFTNGTFSNEIEDSCDDICRDIYKENDCFLTRKVYDLYVMTSAILKDTNFETDMIIVEADW